MVTAAEKYDFLARANHRLALLTGTLGGVSGDRSKKNREFITGLQLGIRAVTVPGEIYEDTERQLMERISLRYRLAELSGESAPQQTVAENTFEYNGLEYNFLEHN